MPPSSEIVEAADVEERDDVFEPVDDTDGKSDDCGDVDESSQYDPIEKPDLVDEFENWEDAWDRVCDAADDVSGPDSPALAALPGNPIVPRHLLSARDPNAPSDGAQGGANSTAVRGRPTTEKVVSSEGGGQASRNVVKKPEDHKNYADWKDESPATIELEEFRDGKDKTVGSKRLLKIRNGSLRHTKGVQILRPHEYYEKFYTCDGKDSMEGLALEDTIRFLEAECEKVEPRHWAVKKMRLLAKGDDAFKKDYRKFIGVLIGLAVGGHSMGNMKEMTRGEWSVRVPWLGEMGVNEDWFRTWMMCVHFQPDGWENKIARVERENGSEITYSNKDEKTNHAVRKIGRHVELLNMQCQDHYIVDRECALDEMTIMNYHRSSPLRHLQPHKPMDGIKVFAVCESKSGYCSNFMFDAKEKTTPAKFPHGKIHYYVKKLTEKLRGLWHHVYMDNYFVTVFTLKTLLAKGVYCTGTCRGGKNSDTRTGFPGAILKPRNARPRKEYEEMVADPSLYACQWQDTGTVQFLSNCHCMGNVGNLKRWINGTREEFEAPAVACDYNTNMAAVDRSDALRSTLTTHRKSVKWYLAIWHWTIDLSLINAYVLYKDEYETLHGNRPGRMDRKTFHTLIAEHYMGGKPKSTSLGSSSRKRSLDASRQDAASSGIVANHQPEVVQAWRPSVKTGGKPGKHEYCVRCVALLPKNSGKRATRTSIRCDTCNKPLCIDCFKPWHNG